MSNDFPFLIANAKPAKDKLSVTAPWDQSLICEVPVANSEAVEIALLNAYGIFRNRDRWCVQNHVASEEEEVRCTGREQRCCDR